MRLAIDLGNTLTKVAVEDASGAFRRLGSLETSAVMADPAAIGRLQGFEGDFAAIASVVPEADLALKRFLAHRDIAFQFLDAQNAPGIAVRYETPETVGADRLANSIWLKDAGELPAVAVDFGTATKLDVVDAGGGFLGGAILPSASMMLEALAGATAKLPRFELTAPIRAIGRSTRDSLQSGTVLALSRAVEGLIADFEIEIGSALRVWVTGGACSPAISCLRISHQLEPDLTLKGLLAAAGRWTSTR